MNLHYLEILNDTFAGCSVTNKTIKFSPIYDINDHLDSKVAIPNDAKESKILILTKKNVNDLIYYKANDSFIELIGFGNFKHEKNKNATTQAYLRGSSNYLNNIEYIQFKVYIGYDTKN